MYICQNFPLWALVKTRITSWELWKITTELQHSKSSTPNDNKMRYLQESFMWFKAEKREEMEMEENPGSMPLWGKVCNNKVYLNHRYQCEEIEEFRKEFKRKGSQIVYYFRCECLLSQFIITPLGRWIWLPTQWVYPFHGKRYWEVRFNLRVEKQDGDEKKETASLFH